MIRWYRERKERKRKRAEYIKTHYIDWGAVAKKAREAYFRAWFSYTPKEGQDDNSQGS